MATGASSHILSSPTVLCVFVVGASHNPFISLNFPLLVSFLFLSISLPLSILLFFLILSIPHTSNIPIASMAFSSSCKRRDRTPSPLKVRTPLVLHKASLMRSLGALLFPYETPGTLLVCSSLGCLPVVQLLCSWMFALYFLILHCMTGCLRLVCPFQPL